MEKKSWFGSLDLAYKYALVFGSLLFAVLILGLIKVMYDRRRMKQHIKLADEEGRSSKGSHRELNMREKDGGDLFGIRAIEAGYFGGVFQSAPNSPVVTPRDSLGDGSPKSASLSGFRYSRAAWPSPSSQFDSSKFGIVSYGDNIENGGMGQRNSQFRMPPSPTISPTFSTNSHNAAWKPPSPTKSPLSSPLKSPLMAPEMAHVRQTALRPSTAELTGRHSHSPPLNMHMEVPPSPLHQISSPSPLMSPSQVYPEHTTIDKHHDEDRLSPIHPRAFDFNSREAPQLVLPDFIGSSTFVVSDFDQPKTFRTSIISKLSISSRRKSMGRSSSTKILPAVTTEYPTLPAMAIVNESNTKYGVSTPAKMINVQPPRGESLPARPMSFESVETAGYGKEYLDYPLPLTITVPPRSPLRLSPASSKRDLRADQEKHSHESNDVSPRTSFSYEKTLSEYQRESITAPPRKYRIGDVPMSSLSPRAISSPLSTEFWAPPPPPRSPRRPVGQAF